MGMLMAGPFLTGWSATMADFKARCEQATDDADHRAVLVAADSLLRMAQAAGNSYYEAYGHYYQGVSNVLLGRAQQGLQQLRRAEQLAQTQHNDTLMVSIYNAYGIYEANKNNYAVARSYFYKSLTRALEQNDRLRQAKLELNLAEVAFLLKDTSGLAYARSAYDWAEANGNDEVMLVGAYQCANLSYLQRKPEEALRYLAKVKKLAEQGHYKEWSSIHKLYADVYLMMGRYAQAEEELEAALANRDNAQAATLPEIYLSYARLRAAQQRYRESNELIEQGLRLAEQHTAYASAADFYRLQAENYEAMGRPQAALAAFKLYKNVSDSIYDWEKEHSMRELGMLYEIDKSEQELAYQRQLLQVARNRTVFLLLMLLFLLVLVGVLLYSYFRQKALYKAIALQNKDALERERLLRERLKELSSAPAPADAGKSPSQPLSTERMDALYERISDLMEEQRLYTDTNLTRERLAELLGTNRTYLSQVINRKTGLTYLQFLNQYRIKEAVRILSDAGNRDYPLKALYGDLGFSSPTTFYKLFQETVGMTPSAYRKTILQLAASSED